MLKKNNTLLELSKQMHTCNKLCNRNHLEFMINCVIQSIVDKTGEIISGEVLIRLEGVSLESFIDNSCINTNIDFDWIILDYIFKNIKKYFKKYNTLHINIFPFTLKDNNFLEKLNNIFIQNNITKNDLNNIYFEIIEKETFLNKEGKIIKSYEDILFNIRENIKSLQKAGIKVGLDDFPEGNSKFLLRYIDNLNFIKIDKQFLLEHKKDFLKEISNLIIEIKKYHKNAKIIIEGIEEGRYIDILEDLGGINYYQGYYFGKPEEIIN